MKYYWLSYCVMGRGWGALSFSSLCSNDHPFNILKRMLDKGMAASLVSWKEITKEEYKLWEQNI